MDEEVDAEADKEANEKVDEEADEEADEEVDEVLTEKTQQWGRDYNGQLHPTSSQSQIQLHFNKQK